MLTVRAALGGPWAGNLTGWLLLLVPASLVVFLQETMTGYSTWLIVLASAIAQHIGSAIVVAGIIAPARRIWSVIPLPINVVAWVLLGTARGLVAAAFASSFTTADPGWVARPLVWIAISVLWMPLITYTLAQVDYRRTLLSRLEVETARFTTEQLRSQRTADELRRTLISAVSRTIAPVIAEVRRSLESVSHKVSPSAVASIGKRLTAVSNETTRIVDVPPLVVPSIVGPRRRAPISEAVTFDRDRPIFAAVLGGVALLPLIVPDTFRVEGVVAAWQAAAAVGVAVVVTAINLSTLRWWAKRVTPPEWTMLLAFVLPGILGGLTLSLLRASPPDLYELLYEILFTFGTVVAGGALSVAVGLTFANAELDSRITEINVSALKLSQHSSLAEQRARDQVAALMHGPIYGRLSACAMALNFHAAELQQGGTERTDFIMTTVREYLDAAFRDLELLSTT